MRDTGPGEDVTETERERVSTTGGFVPVLTRMARPFRNQEDCETSRTLCRGPASGTVVSPSATVEAKTVSDIVVSTPAVAVGAFRIANDANDAKADNEIFFGFPR